MRRSAKGRRLCREESCDVEIPEEAQYCAAHQWWINKWLAESKKKLAEYIAKAKEKGF